MCAALAKAPSVAVLLPASNRFEMLSGHSPHTAILPSAASTVSVTEGNDQLGGILRLRQRLGDDEGDRFANIAHCALREAEKGASEHRRPVRPLALERD